MISTRKYDDVKANMNESLHVFPENRPMVSFVVVAVVTIVVSFCGRRRVFSEVDWGSVDSVVSIGVFSGAAADSISIT